MVMMLSPGGCCCNNCKIADVPWSDWEVVSGSRTINEDGTVEIAANSVLRLAIPGNNLLTIEIPEIITELFIAFTAHGTSLPGDPAFIRLRDSASRNFQVGQILDDFNTVYRSETVVQTDNATLSIGTPLLYDAHPVAKYARDIDDRYAGGRSLMTLGKTPSHPFSDTATPATASSDRSFSMQNPWWDFVSGTHQSVQYSVTKQHPGQDYATVLTRQTELYNDDYGVYTSIEIRTGNDPITLGAAMTENLDCFTFTHWGGGWPETETGFEIDATVEFNSGGVLVPNKIPGLGFTPTAPSWHGREFTEWTIQTHVCWSMVSGVWVNGVVNSTFYGVDLSRNYPIEIARNPSGFQPVQEAKHLFFDRTYQFLLDQGARFPEEPGYDPPSNPIPLQITIVSTWIDLLQKTWLRVRVGLNDLAYPYVFTQVPFEWNFQKLIDGYLPLENGDITLDAVGAGVLPHELFTPGGLAAIEQYDPDYYNQPGWFQQYLPITTKDETRGGTCRITW